jgi:hypothetical protein
MRDDRQDHFAAKRKDEERKDGNVDTGELDMNKEEDVWAGMGEYEAEGGSRTLKFSTPRP